MQLTRVGLRAVIHPVFQIKTVLDVVLHTRLGDDGELERAVRPKVRVLQRWHDVVTRKVSRDRQMLIRGDGGLRGVATGITAPTGKRVALIRDTGHGHFGARRVMILQRGQHNPARAGGVAVDHVVNRHVSRQAGHGAEPVRQTHRVLAGVGLRGLIKRQRISRGVLDCFIIEKPLIVEWIAHTAHRQAEPRTTGDHLIFRLRGHLRQDDRIVGNRLIPLERRDSRHPERLAKRNTRLAWLPDFVRKSVGDVRPALIVKQLHLEAIRLRQAKRGGHAAFRRGQCAAQRGPGRDHRGEIALQCDPKIIHRYGVLSGKVKHRTLARVECHFRVLPRTTLEHVHRQLAGGLVQLGQGGAIREPGEQLGQRVAILATQRVSDERFAGGIRHPGVADGVF